MRIQWRSIKNRLQTNRDSIKGWSETLKNFAEILGIVLAAIWTYQLFIKKEKPGLETRVGVTSNLNLKNMNAEWCDVDFRVELENIGISSFKIRKIRIRAWKFDRNQIGDKGVAYIDANEIMKKGEQIFTVEHTAKEVASDPEKLVPFIRSYPPGHSFGHSFDVLVKKNKSHDLPVESRSNMFLFFLSEFYTEDNQPGAKSYTSKWSPMCVD